MLYLFAFVLPPVAILMAGRKLAALVNLVVACTLLGYPFAVIHALLVVNEQAGAKRMTKVLAAQEELRLASMRDVA
jgi:uncharacterized membrane protein YqaE (UPF0057 family)